MEIERLDEIEEVLTKHFGEGYKDVVSRIDDMTEEEISDLSARVGISQVELEAYPQASEDRDAEFRMFDPEPDPNGRG